MNFQFWAGMNEQMKPLIEDYFKNRLLEILPERKIFFSVRNGITEPSLYNQGWDDCLIEIKKRAGLNE